MPDKSSFAEFMWLMRLRQGTFFERGLAYNAPSDLETYSAIGFFDGEADSTLSVLNRASEPGNQDYDDD